MVFTDDYSGSSYTYFLKEKSDAVKATEKFLSDIAPYGKVKSLNFYEDVFPARDMKRIRSDNGGEYLAGNFKALLVKHCIKHEFTSPHSPDQNGTLFEKARALNGIYQIIYGLML